jgi:hypothetical protein
LLSAQIHKEETNLKGRKPNKQKKMPLGQTPYYKLIERHYENEALETTVSPED